MNQISFIVLFFYVLFGLIVLGYLWKENIDETIISVFILIYLTSLTAGFILFFSPFG